MKFYLAPMEEVTGYVFRNVHSRLFGKLDKYVTPFVSPMQKRGLKSRDRKEIDPQNNKDLPVVPQVLTNHAEALVHTARLVKGLGYGELNLNLGCPSATVVPKRKGSGFLADPEELESFFQEVYFQLKSTDPVISVKTRLGLTRPEEFYDILPVFNRYPIGELIIHPRIQTDFYRNQPKLEYFAWAMSHCPLPLCYNGDITDVDHYCRLRESFPSLGAVMIGRGLVRNPALVREIKGGDRVTSEELSVYERELYKGYCEAYGEERNAVFKMKEVWYYLSDMLPEETREKKLKKIRKATRPDQYRQAADEAFSVKA
ncbi:MAG: tRNA-dihydrouridine synthase family protein [Blautia sp.]|nr:tRNA-dihydrouridine synthase family protein [Blautia sp.]